MGVAIRSFRAKTEARRRNKGRRRRLCCEMTKKNGSAKRAARKRKERAERLLPQMRDGNIAIMFGAAFGPRKPSRLRRPPTAPMPAPVPTPAEVCAMHAAAVRRLLDVPDSSADELVELQQFDHRLDDHAVGQVAWWTDLGPRTGRSDASRLLRWLRSERDLMQILRKRLWPSLVELA